MNTNSLYRRSQTAHVHFRWRDVVSFFACHRCCLQQKPYDGFVDQERIYINELKEKALDQILRMQTTE